MWALLATGFLSILGQVVLLRELAVASFGVELIYLVGLGVWMLGSATGALIDWRARVPRRAGIAWLLVAVAGLIPCAVAFVRAGRLAFGGVPGAYSPFTAQLALTAIALGPPAVALGLLFQWSARNQAFNGGTLAAAYRDREPGRPGRRPRLHCLTGARRPELEPGVDRRAGSDLRRGIWRRRAGSAWPGGSPAVAWCWRS